MKLTEIVSQKIGKRRKINREDMSALLAEFATAGVPLANDCVEDGSPAAWSARCRGLTCISVSYGDGGEPQRYHGNVRYDSPGEMSPLHYSDVMFVPASLQNSEYDQIGQLRKKCSRLVMVV